MRRRPAVRSLRVVGAVLLVALSGFPAVGRAAAEGFAAWTWVLESGVFDVEEGEAAFVGFEARHRPRLWGVFPLVGGLVTGNDSLHLRLGLGRDFPIGERIVFTVSSAAGYWEPGDGPDLGHDLEFRSALDVHWRIRQNLRMGLTVAHLSNAGLSDHNPGLETLSVSLAWRP